MLRFCEQAGLMVIFGAQALASAVRRPYEPREILRHLFEFGFTSAPLVLMAGVAVGVVLSMHTRASLEQFGAETMIPAGLAIAMVRETGPLLTGLEPPGTGSPSR